MNNKTEILAEYDKNSILYSNFAHKVRQLLEELINGENISCNSITCRLKAKDSLTKKIELKQNKYTHLCDLTDIAGIRIITYYSDDVDKVINLVENEFDVDINNTIDKRKALEPDRFGYCSVHYIVSLSSQRLKLREYSQFKGLKCEIQIRTVLQHAWAEIEHDLGYKNEIAIPKDIRRSFSRIAGLLEIGDKEFSNIRNYLETYTSKITEKISDCELNNTELDAIILNEFIKTDKDLAKLNAELEKLFYTKIHDDFLNHSIAMELIRFKWLNIKTLGQLKNLISENKDTALAIAQMLLITDGYNKYKAKKANIDSAIGFFYLCYAELLNKYPDYISVSNFLKETNIQANKEFINELLEIGKKLKLGKNA